MYLARFESASAGQCGCNDKGRLHLEATDQLTGEGDDATGSVYCWGLADILWPAAPVPDADLALQAAQVLPAELAK